MTLPLPGDLGIRYPAPGGDSPELGQRLRCYSGSVDPDAVVVARDSALRRRLEALAEARTVFFAGLPGTGKSLLLHQLAHLAHAAGRVIHLLQWDVSRPVFEASDAGRRYPLVDGVTHAVIRKAVGLWVRRALVEWDSRCPEAGHLLVGETPFVGNRFIELARREEDAAEALLAASSCRFVIPVPSREVRAFLEAERGRRAARPLHEREREDAPPRVLRDLWRELVDVAGALEIVGDRGVRATPVSQAPDAGAPWDPLVYRRVYEALLRHRHREVIDLDVVLPTAALSVYDFAITPRDLVPRPEEAAACILEVEARHPEPEALEREIARWWVV